MVGGLDLHVEQLERERRDEAVPVDEEVRAVVVEERVAADRHVVAHEQDVREAHGEPDRGDDAEADEEAPAPVVAHGRGSSRRSGTRSFSFSTLRSRT